jgi:excinuclease ABC subunit C
LIKNDLKSQILNPKSTFRIEAYDIAHISGKDAVGVMTVVEDGELNKSQYRKFKIGLDKNDDTANLKEVLTRRLNHPEWRLPDLIVVDGGVGQINAAREVLKLRSLEVPVVSVVKDERHKARGIMGELGAKEKYEKAILLANSEAHRFAIGYHRRLRGKGFRI